MSTPTERRFGPIRFIPGLNRGKYPFCHSLLIEADRRVLIDPASDRDRLVALDAEARIDEVWLSHYHEDHFMHLDRFEDRSLVISAPDAPALSGLDPFHDAYGIHDPALREQWTGILGSIRASMLTFGQRSEYRRVGKRGQDGRLRRFA